MDAQKTKFSVGLFVFSGMVIAVMAIVWLGMSRILEKGHYYVTYFNESVQGLDTDAAVKYRGVTIGRVERIEVAPDSKLIQVVLKIESGQKLAEDTVAQLKLVGITGSIFVELDRKKPGEPDRSPALNFPSEYPIVASKPSDIKVLLGGIDDVIKEVKALDLRGISDKVKSTLDTLDRVISEAKVPQMTHTIQTTFDSAKQIFQDEGWRNGLTSIEVATESLNHVLARASGILETGQNALSRVDGIVDEEGQILRTALQDFKRAMENANILLEKGSSFIRSADDSLSSLKTSLMVTARNLEVASENLNHLVETIADHPSQLLFGEPPLPRKIDPAKGERE